MAVKIRLARLGCINRVFYRIHLQVVGFYDPLAAKGDARRLGLNVDLVKCWLSVGAHPIDTVRGILNEAGLISPPPMVLFPIQSSILMRAGVGIFFLFRAHFPCPM
ncbi:small ribosomal subunit protein bS16cy-like isoform X2 [Populus alba]|uniref:small ribosomal subunit protein bS16cy-like isoform X2 n=1 Tax=Populus alba TaxID=43335 RepID=UPI00158D7725|nr:30S ribosomal protein S16-1, chloroplastic-like [Populus alba]